MTWGGLNPALNAWRNGINQRFPRRGTASDGGYADKVHGSASQHQPDTDGTVDAFDCDVNLLGSTVASGTVTERLICEALKADFEDDGRSQLWIHQREIANRDIGNWRIRPYGGDSPHDHHIHFQSRQALEDDGRAWKFTHTDALLRRMNGDDMQPKDLLDLDDVPNPYHDSAKNPNITVRSALKGAAQADATTRDTQAAVALLRKDVHDLKQVVARILAAVAPPA